MLFLIVIRTPVVVQDKKLQILIAEVTVVLKQ